MKKAVVFFLSVIMMISVTACGFTNEGMSKADFPEMESEIIESSEVDDESDLTNKELEETVSSETELEEEKPTETEKAQDNGKETSKEPVVSNDTKPTKPTNEQPPKEAEKKEEVPKEEPKKEEPKQEQPKLEEPKVEVVSYDPNQVVSLAIAKCQAGGMITTTDNLNNLLAEGKISKEEYDSYYPYDGLGYYSVFVESNLNDASTVSGRKLGSVEGIAEHIAGMMLLETDPLFNIGYAGTYNKSGVEFYEFRCYR